MGEQQEHEQGAGDQPQEVTFRIVVAGGTPAEVYERIFQQLEALKAAAPPGMAVSGADIVAATWDPPQA